MSGPDDDDDLVMLPWFPKDFLAATRGWPLIARAIYRELLDAQWDLGALPDSTDELAEIARAKPAEFAQAWPRVREKFVADGRGRLINLKLEKHRAKAFALRDARSSAGRTGGLRSGESRRREANDEANAKQNASGASSLLEANAQAKTKPPSPSPSPSPSGTPSPSPSDPVPDVSVVPDTSVSARTSARTHARSESGEKSGGTEKARKLPVPFLVTPRMRAWAAKHTPNVDVEKATKEFERYWSGLGGAKGRRTNWDGVWKNRMVELEDRSQTDRRNPRDESRTTTKFDRIMEALDDGN